MTRSAMIGAAFCAALLFTACGPKKATTPVPTETAQQKIAKANAVLAVATNGATQTTVNLCNAGVLTQAQCNDVMAYEGAVARFSAGVADILKQNTAWQQQVPQLIALSASIPPASVLAKYTGLTEPQFQALVTSLQTVTTTVQLVVEIEAQP